MDISLSVSWRTQATLPRDSVFGRILSGTFHREQWPMFAVRSRSIPGSWIESNRQDSPWDRRAYRVIASDVIYDLSSRRLQEGPRELPNTCSRWMLLLSSLHFNDPRRMYVRGEERKFVALNSKVGLESCSRTVQQLLGFGLLL